MARKLEEEIGAYLELIDKELARHVDRHGPPEPRPETDSGGGRTKPVLELIEETLRKVQVGETAEARQGTGRSLDYSEVIRDLEREMNRRRGEETGQETKRGGQSRRRREDGREKKKRSTGGGGDEKMDWGTETETETGTEPSTQQESRSQLGSAGEGTETSISKLSMTMSGVTAQDRRAQVRKSAEKVRRLKTVPQKRLMELIELQSLCTENGEPAPFEGSFNFDLSVSKINSEMMSPKHAIFKARKSNFLSPIVPDPARNFAKRTLPRRLGLDKEVRWQRPERNESGPSRERLDRELAELRARMHQRLARIEADLF